MRCTKGQEHISDFYRADSEEAWHSSFAEVMSQSGHRSGL